MLDNPSLLRQSPHRRNICSDRRPWWLLAAVIGCSPVVGLTQTVFLDFNTVGEYTNNFNPWNDNAGANGGNYSFAEGTTAGVNGGGGVSVFQSVDTTATYNQRSWDFSTSGSAIAISVMVQANGQISGNKAQLGLLNSDTNGLNNNAGVAFESYRFVPASATSLTLREQYHSGAALVETNLGTINTTVGNWYRFVVTLTNVSGASGGYNAACAIYDYGANGITPGANIVGFLTLQSHTGQTDITVPALWPALRAFQNGGINAWDNFLVYTPASPPVITLGLTNTTVASGQKASFQALAEGPGTITFSWYTNGTLAAGTSAPSYTTPPVDAGYTNIMVVASNGNGSATNFATIRVFVPSPARLNNQAASNIQASSATLNGQVLDTGGATPTITLFYGPTDGGTNPAAWAQSVSLGIQSGPFAQTVSGLSSNTAYFFTAEAINSAGSSWAVPSGSFTTLLTNTPFPASAAVLTQHNDNNRSGDNLQETLLTTTNVNTNQFGLLVMRPVDDQVYAQPLIMTNVSMPGQGVHNLLLIATVNDTIYAYDADDVTVTAPYWTNSFINPPNIVAPNNADESAIGACGGGYQDFSGKLGIVGTPVIDPATATLYVVVRTKEFGSSFVQRLHALDVATGQDRGNSPVVITATFPGTGDGSSGGVVPFDPIRNNQRPALTLVNGVVYITWSSHCDNGPYHGWVIGYQADTLQQVAVYNDTPNGSEAGIWMSGQGPCADTSGNIYFTTGNGSVDTTDFGESFLKVSPANSGTLMNTASFFTPLNWSSLNSGDVDLGSAGILLIPGTPLAISGGKQSVLYLVNRDSMGGISGGIQNWSLNAGQIHGGPVWWAGPNGSFLYVWADSSARLAQFQFNGSTFNTTPFAQGRTVGGSGSPGGILSVSANGTNAGSGILWAVVNTTSDANQAVVPGTLHAYNAQNVSSELWNSDMVTRDALGNLAKFVPPTVANGKVYLATFSGRVNVYGLKALPVADFTGSPTTGSSPLAVSFTDNSTGTITNRSWDFGDNTSTNTIVTSLTHVYAGPGTNTVRLTVSGLVGTNTFTRTSYIVVTNQGAVTLLLQSSGNQLQLTWPAGTLQSSSLVNGPYADVTNVTSPFVVSPSNASQFFRIRVR